MLSEPDFSHSQWKLFILVWRRSLPEQDGKNFWLESTQDFGREGAQKRLQKRDRDITIGPIFENLSSQGF